MPWPWYVAGPSIALVMGLLVYFGKSFGVSSNLRTMCSLAGAGNYVEFFKFDWKSQIWNLVRPVVTEKIVGDKIECDNCGWSWKIVDGGNDLYICHKCDYDNTPRLNENATYSQNIDYMQMIQDLTNHMIKQGRNIEPLPKLKIENGDSENAKNFFGKNKIGSSPDFAVIKWNDPEDHVESPRVSWRPVGLS